MSTCIGLKKTGERCAATVEPPQTYCWWHDPANADQRSRAASKAAKAKAQPGEIGEVKQQLRELVDDVLEGRVDKGKGSIVSEILGVWLHAVETERRVRETDELLERLDELETMLEGQNGRRTWGA
jgi:predicted RNA-binding Zn ribbon-like protein